MVRLYRCLVIALQQPTADGLTNVVETLTLWQHEGAPIQLHPGDLGWQWRFGADSLARALRVWSRDQEILAVGFVDLDLPSGGTGVIRMGVAPSADQDEDLARVLVNDLEDPSRGVLSAGTAIVEARFGQAFRSLLNARGWVDDEPWTPLYRNLAEPVEHSGLRVETVGPDRAEERTAVQRSAFDRSTFTVERWLTMATGVPYQQARCVLGYDGDDRAVAAATVWSAGPGRPGLLEPMGVHREHRGQGHGRAITLAAAAALREMGSSSAIVATPTSNAAAVATYVAAGFRAEGNVTDFRRPA
jgi:ribosomal protein S18 acetylase RimI-like enzyme